MSKIPGIPPTGRKLRIPFTSVINIRGDRLYHEHIAWDQATVLIQLGLLPEYLPYPHDMLDGRQPGEGNIFEVRILAAGVETVAKMLDKNGVKSNEMLEYKIREVSIVR
jgi:carboxymethylenebutenolidase